MRDRIFCYFDSAGKLAARGKGKFERVSCNPLDIPTILCAWLVKQMIVFPKAKLLNDSRSRVICNPF
jgi:hypothetical protein